MRLWAWGVLAFAGFCLLALVGVPELRACIDSGESALSCAFDKTVQSS